VDVQVTGRDSEQEARNVILTFLPWEINTNPVVNHADFPGWLKK
jgi:hypothetical protein